MPDAAHPRHWSQRTEPRAAVRTAVVWDALDVLVGKLAATAARPLDVIDVGGGTGGFAVPLACLGHLVTVVDPSPDALAALQRRAAEADVADRIRPLQGDAGALVPLLGDAAADVVLCHGVLEYTDDPAGAVQDVAQVLRGGGLFSLLAAQRLGAVLARALSGRFVAARRILTDPAGRAGGSDPMPRRFDLDQVLALLAGADLQVRVVHGVRLFADLLPGALVDDPDAASALLDLERIAGDQAAHPELTSLAAQLHVVAERS